MRALRILGLIISFSATGAFASPTVIGSINNSDDFVMDASQNLSCIHYDTDRDGVKDATQVRLIGPRLGFLAKGEIYHVVKNSDESICEDVKTIVDRSHMNFTGIATRVTSELLLDRSGNIVENYSIDITNLTQRPDSPVVTVSGTVTKKLNQ